MSTDYDTLIGNAFADELDSEDTLSDPTLDAESPAEEVASELAEDETDEPTGSDEESEDDDEEDDSAPTDAIEVSDDTVLKLPDGTTVSVKDGIELKAAFTKKTQALSEEREAVDALRAETEQEYTRLQEWVAEAETNPAALVGAIVERGGVNKAELIARLIAEDEKPTNLQAQVFAMNIKAKTYEDGFVSALGFKNPEHPVLNLAARAAEQDRIARLEREVAAARQAPPAEEEPVDQSAQFAAWESQFQRIVADNELELDDDAAQDMRVELLQYARELTERTGEEKYLTDLELAYLHRERELAKQASSKAQNTRAARKATQVVNKKSAATAGAPPKTKSPESLADAFSDAFGEL